MSEIMAARDAMHPRHRASTATQLTFIPPALTGGALTPSDTRRFDAPSTMLLASRPDVSRRFLRAPDPSTDSEPSPSAPSDERWDAEGCMPADDAARLVDARGADIAA